MQKMRLRKLITLKMILALITLLSMGCGPKSPQVDLCVVLNTMDPDFLLYCSNGKGHKYNLTHPQAASTRHQCMSLTDYQAEENYVHSLEKDLASCQASHR